MVRLVLSGLMLVCLTVAYKVGEQDKVQDRFQLFDSYNQAYSEVRNTEFDARRYKEGMQQQGNRDADVNRYVPGEEYKYFYDGQILNGIPGSSKQHSGTRIQCLVRVQVPTERTLVLKLESVRIGKLNKKIANPMAPLPFQVFEPVPLKEQFMNKLEKPIKFIYQDGLIQDVLHEPSDEAWSMNIKRGILNLFQVNLLQHGQTDNTDDMKMTNTIASSQLGEAKFFRVMEKTLEGECETAYTVLDNTAGGQQDQTLNVTKSINFERCNQRPQIRYNWRFGSQCPTCDPKYDDEERFLKSSTVIKYNITGNRNNFLIECAKAESQYTLVWYGEEGSVINVYVNQTLRLYSTRAMGSPIPVPTMQSPSKLIYSMDFEMMKEKFFLEADTQFLEKNPYSKIEDKPQLVKKLLKELVQSSNANNNVPVSPEAPKLFARVVVVMRMCTKTELEQIHSQIYKNTPSEFNSEELKFVQDICEQAIALCGTEPAIELLTEKIMSEEIPASRGASVLRQLSTVRVASVKAVNHLKDLCESEVVESGDHYALKKACFLSLGSLMRAACQSQPDKLAVEFKSAHSRCSMSQKQDYSKYLCQRMKNAQSWQNKVLYLKSLGNAGLDVSIQDLEEIIENRDQHYAPYIRSEAILALRHVKEHMPRKIQKVLMPVFMNSREHSSVRQVAAYIILKSMPDRPILDMMAKQINVDHSRQVASFTWSLMNELANTTNPCYEQLAADLKLALRLTRQIDPSILTHSKARRFSFQDTERKIGMDMNLYSVMSNRSILPRTLSMNINANLFGAYKRNLISATVSADGLMPMVRKLVEKYSEYRSTLVQLLKQRRRRDTKDVRAQIREIFDKLQIQHRDADFNEQESKAYAYMRFMGQDFAFAPFDVQRIREYLEEGKLSLGDMERYLRSGLPFNSHHATVLHETQYQVPTCMGLPLVIKNKIPMVTRFEGKVKVDFDSSDPLRDMGITFDIKPSMVIEAVQKVEILCPIVNTGIKVRGFISAFSPIKAKLSGSLRKEQPQLKISFEPPTSERKLLHVATQPVTYTCERSSSQVNQYQEADEKVIRSQETNRMRLVNRDMDMPLLGTEFVLRGNYIPNYRQRRQSMPICPLAGPSKLIVTARPSIERSDKVELKIWGKYEGSAQEAMTLNLLKNSPINESPESSESQSSEEIPRQYSATRRCRTELNLELTSGQSKATVQLQSNRGSGGRLHQYEVKVHRSASGNNGNRRPAYEICMEAESLLPEEPFTSKSVRGKKVAQRAEIRWGESCLASNFITISATSERTYEQLEHERETMEEYRRCRQNEQESPIACYEYLTEAGKMTKHNIDIKYNNVPVEFRNITAKAFRALKAYYYRNTDVASVEVRNPSNQIRATIRIDPEDHRRVNVTLRTPTRNVTMCDIQLPCALPEVNVKLPVYKNVAENLKFLPRNSRSFRPVCKVERNAIETFDGTEYACPLSSCWSVLAKDCSADEKFTVLVKKQTQDSRRKVVKILTHDHEIKLKRESEHITVYIDGQEIPESEIAPRLERGNIIIRKEGPYVAVKLNQEGVRVYYDGFSTRVKLSPLYENLQCGLCGNMDREPDNEFYGPDNTEMSDRRDFFRRYTIQDQNKCRFPTDLNEICRDESCSVNNQERETEDQSSESRSREHQSGENRETQRRTQSRQYRKSASPQYLNRVIERNGKTCLSREPVPMCPENAYMQDVDQREVDYVCMDRFDQRTSELAQAAERAPVKEVRTMATTFSRTEMVPKTCRRYE